MDVKSSAMQILGEESSNMRIPHFLQIVPAKKINAIVPYVDHVLSEDHMWPRQATQGMQRGPTFI